MLVKTSERHLRGHRATPSELAGMAPLLQSQSQDNRQPHDRSVPDVEPDFNPGAGSSRNSIGTQVSAWLRGVRRGSQLPDRYATIWREPHVGAQKPVVHHQAGSPEYHYQRVHGGDRIENRLLPQQAVMTESANSLPHSQPTLPRLEIPNPFMSPTSTSKSTYISKRPVATLDTIPSATTPSATSEYSQHSGITRTLDKFPDPPSIPPMPKIDPSRVRRQPPLPPPPEESSSFLDLKRGNTTLIGALLKSRARKVPLRHETQASHIERENSIASAATDDDAEAAWNSRSRIPWFGFASSSKVGLLEPLPMSDEPMRMNDPWDPQPEPETDHDRSGSVSSTKSRLREETPKTPPSIPLPPPPSFNSIPPAPPIGPKGPSYRTHVPLSSSPPSRSRTPRPLPIPLTSPTPSNHSLPVDVDAAGDIDPASLSPRPQMRLTSPRF